MADDPRGWQRMPADWAEAFARLPVETPPRDAWAAMLRRVATPTAPERRVRRRVRALATAATIALAVAGMFAWQTSHDDLLQPRVVAVPGRSPAIGAKPASTPDTAGSGRTAGVVGGTTPTTNIAANADDALRVLADAPADRSPVANPSARHATAAPVHRSEPVVASTGRTAHPSHDAMTAPTDADALDRLRTESARLEALAAYARDDRMTSAPAAVLAGDVEDRLRLIDAALSQPDLADAQRVDLWTRRVAALRELAGVEGTRRWMAANGESLQGAIALVD